MDVHLARRSCYLTMTAIFPLISSARSSEDNTCLRLEGISTTTPGRWEEKHRRTSTHCCLSRCSLHPLTLPDRQSRARRHLQCLPGNQGCPTDQTWGTRSRDASTSLFAPDPAPAICRVRLRRRRAALAAPRAKPTAIEMRRMSLRSL